MDLWRTWGSLLRTPDSREIPWLMTIFAEPTEQPECPACGGNHQMLSMSAIWISYCRPRVLFMMPSASLHTTFPNSGFKASCRMAAPATRMSIGRSTSSRLFCLCWGTYLQDRASTLCCTMLDASAAGAPEASGWASQGRRLRRTSGWLLASLASTTRVMGDSMPTLKCRSNCSNAWCSSVSRRLPCRWMSKEGWYLLNV
mmetsp:Transcript_106391/g.300865  ORF Transcript_106391/g.300865 Transcript_106391/m.300865 type:complete len:200 (-) Transcript_106391:1390-1989(-)